MSRRGVESLARVLWIFRSSWMMGSMRTKLVRRRGCRWERWVLLFVRTLDGGMFGIVRMLGME